MCIEIVTTLEERPLYKIFRSKVKFKTSPDQNEMEALSLPIIKARIENGDIETLEDFQKGMELWFKFKGHNVSQLVHRGLNELRRQYDKQLSRLKSSLSRDSWMELCNSAKTKLDTLLDQPPPVVVMETREELTPDQLNFLARAVARVSSPLDVYKISKILENDPFPIDMDRPDVAVDVSKLQRETLKNLFDFLHGKFPDALLLA